jgi:hypothetical protein
MIKLNRDEKYRWDAACYTLPLMRILKTQLSSQLRAFLRSLREDCGSEQLLEQTPDVTTRKPRSSQDGRRIRISTSKVLIALAVMLPVTSGVAFSATGHVFPDLGTAASSFTWSSAEPIDQGAPYARATPINSMTCASPTLCLGTTEPHGELLTSTSPSGTTAGTWSVLQTSLISEGATGYSLAGASCVTAGASPFCLAVGRNFNNVSEPGIAITSTEPTGGASKWQKTTFPIGITEQPSCVYESPTTLCAIAVGFGPEVETSTDPSGGIADWHKINFNFTQSGNGTSGIACPSIGLCMVVDYGGQFSVASEPTKESSWSTPTATGLEDADTLSCPTTTFCLAAGSNEHTGAAEIATTTDPSAGATATWHVSTPTGVPDLGDLGRVSCSPDSALASPHAICYASAASGAIGVSTDGGATWVSETFPGALGEFEQSPLTCPSSSLCVAGTQQGAITTSADAASGETATWSSALAVTEGYNGVEVFEHSCPFTKLCVATDGAGRIMTSTEPSKGASSWSVESPFEPFVPVTALDCVSSELCVATNADGEVLSSTEPAKGSKSWTTATVDPGVGISRLACPSSQLCVAIDHNGDVLSSTNPSGAATAWTTPASLNAGQFIGTLVCPSTTLCVATNSNGEVLTSTHPADGVTSWTAPETTPDPLHTVSCPATTLCVASDDGDILYSTDPSAGASSWSSGVNVAPESIANISCPSTVLCVATEQNNVLESTDPAIGGVSWSKPAALAIGYLAGLECPTSSLCSAFDYQGDVFTTTNPGAGVNAWTAADHVAGSEEITGQSCPSATLCVLGASDGSVITGKGVAVPEQTDAPFASGVYKEGETLTVFSSMWTNFPTSFTWQWERCDSTGGDCKEVPGAVAKTYLLGAADVGSTLRVKETATNAGGAGPTAISAVTPVIEAATTSKSGGGGSGGGEPPSGGTSGETPSTPTTTPAPPPAAVITPLIIAPLPTAAQILADLSGDLTPSGKLAKLATILKTGSYSYSFTAPGPGALLVDWYLLPKGAHLSSAKPVLIASGQEAYTAATTAKITIKLTGRGKSDLKRAKSVKLTSKGSFTPTGGAAVSSVKTFVLKK